MEMITLSGIGTVLLLVGIPALYFLPMLIASRNKNKNASAIGALNLFLGWTLIGWVGALIWALRDQEAKRCRFCAEAIKQEATVCRYCGKDQQVTVPFMTATPAPTQAAPAPSASRPVLRDVSALTSLCEGCGAHIPKARADRHRCHAAALAK